MRIRLRASQNMQFRPCPTPLDHKRIASSASYEVEISRRNPNESNFHKRLTTTIISGRPAILLDAVQNSNKTATLWHSVSVGLRVTATGAAQAAAYTARTTGIGQQLSLIHISEPTRLGMISYAVF